MSTVTISKHTLQQLIDAAEYAAEVSTDTANMARPGTPPHDDAVSAAEEFSEAARAARKALGIDTD